MKSLLSIVLVLTASLATVAGLFVCLAAVARGADSPNVVLILADDSVAPSPLAPRDLMFMASSDNCFH